MRNSRQKLVLAGVAAAIALLVGCAGPTQSGEASPPEVAVHTVKTAPATLSVTLPGRTAAHQVAEVRPQITGIVTARLFEEGRTVKAGAPLFQIDEASYQAAYESAGAGLERAEALVASAASREKRLAALVKINAVSDQNYDDAVAAAKQARADVGAARAARDAAKINLERTTIVAPIDGRIGRTLVTVGALVAANQLQQLAVIHALDPIYVDVVQSSADILRWKRKLENNQLDLAGDNQLGVSLTLEDGTVYDHKGKLQLAEVSVDPSTGSVTLRAIFPNPDNLLLPGMFVRTEIVEGVRDDAILVPQQAVTRTPAGEGMAIVVDGENKTIERVVETGRAVGDQWIVTAGLEPGERIVVEGFQRFRPGDTVSPVDGAQVADASKPRTASGPGGGRP